MRNFFRLCPLFLAVALMFGAGPAFAGKRVALVLANSAYQHAPQLTNPVNDGSVMAKTLKDAGFDVVDSRHDLTALDTRRVLREFADLPAMPTSPSSTMPAMASRSKAPII